MPSDQKRKPKSKADKEAFGWGEAVKRLKRKPSDMKKKKRDYPITKSPSRRKQLDKIDE